jgi:hypothetical protein
MLIERLNNDVIITVSSKVDSFGLQKIMDYLKYLEISSKSKGKKSDVESLAKKVNDSWWSKNRKNFIK